MEEPALGITKFRSYYEELIMLSVADFGTEPGKRHSGKTGNFHGGGLDDIGTDPAFADPDREEAEVNNGILGKKTKFFGGISLSTLILILYITGVMYFLVRFVYLIIRLFLLARKNGIHKKEGFRVVEIKEDISPFSFFRFLFINNSFFNESELENVLEHEKAHIRQRHSIDHLFIHGLAIFQWFNPFAWQMRKALKTTHEYIADRQVINRGFELFDYQSLLLKQVIGYHSVELVNNFNLKPIKNRIFMMNKTKSGFPAKLKALLVIPFAIAIFLFFADFTLVKPGDTKLNLKTLLTENKIKTKLEGLWICQSMDEFSEKIHFTADKISFAMNSEIRSYYWKPEAGKLILSDAENAKGTAFKYELKGDVLKFWWSEAKSSQYRKSKAGNTLDHFLMEQDMNIELPSISQFRLMEKQDNIVKICMAQDANGSIVLTLDGKKTGMEEIQVSIEKKLSQINKLEKSSFTTMLYIDKTIPMGKVEKLREELRKAIALKTAEGGYPYGSDHEVSELLFHTVGLPRMLPPLDTKLVSKEEVKKDGIVLFEIKLSERNLNPADLESSLKKLISENEKYLFSLEYDDEIPYGQYIETVDMVYKVIYEFRNNLAMEKHQHPYSELGPELQKEIRKAYPIMLSEGWN